ncbi:type VI secretion system tip protein VgrG [Luteimonas yindakuii]|uniref:type VI secretion system Vgr family protein n=1 Tax=Luteimonas yindakuii TaxID=2565782 RepID=UPI00110780F5|nr:type VI secretion system Vgr family protein [Luteimonas yindakuii]QCU72617.1 type VI secretion system tip protein VgrG [Luteimonas yindakuii]
MDMPALAREALAALSVPSQHARLIQLTAPVDGLVVERFHGSEAVCAPFRFEVDVLSTSAFVEPGALLGETISLHLRRADGGMRDWHGLCAEVAPLGGDGGMARYRLTLVPWTEWLRHRRNARIFQDMDVRAVIEALLGEVSCAAWRFDVTRRLPVHAITTQYRESDWDFLVRLLADSGLAWRYEHAQRGTDAGTDRNAGHTLVIFDSDAELPRPLRLRFHRADASEAEDSITALGEQRELVPNRSVVGSWHSERVEAVSGEATGAHNEATPALEIFVQPRAGRFADAAHASDEATFRLDAARLRGWRLDGAGTARTLAAGHPITIGQHPRHEGATLTPLAVEHVGANNLGSGITALLARPDLEQGSYRNRFIATPVEVPVAPLPGDRPRVHGPQTARVVGLPEAAVTPNRDHQVRIQFAWQRGERPNPGGLSAESHAPGDHTSGTWVPVAEWLAGPNWGSHFLPRIGAEVLVEFLHGDIDQPRITGQLYNGEAGLPFAAGIDGSTNHRGTLSGLHTQGHDGDGTQQWVIDDTPGQLRTRLHTTLADSRLELGYLIAHGDQHRGALRGQGVELATAGWGNVHAAQGLLLSTTARPDGASTQMDMAESVTQLKGAERTAEALHDTMCQQEVPGLEANGRLVAMREAVDPEVDCAYRADVAGQSAMKPAAGGREPGDAPVERFADARVIAESPESIAFVTPKSAIAYAGGAMHLTVQDDAHVAAGHTVSWVSGQHTALYAHAGPIRAIAANGPVSLQAHTGELEVLADQSVTLTATDDRIDVLAQQKIVLQAGHSRVVLEGGDITFECPGEFTVKASQHPFRGGESVAPGIESLPQGTVSTTSPRKFSFSR